jgi:hypothetical protein
MSTESRLKMSTFKRWKCPVRFLKVRLAKCQRAQAATVLQWKGGPEDRAPVETDLSAVPAPLPGQSGVEDLTLSALWVLPWQWTQSDKLTVGLPKR